MAPAANPERFSETKKVEKWFKRNCNDVLDRECTAQEKGDVMSYLMAAGTKAAVAPEAVKVVEAAKVEAPAKAAAPASAAHHTHGATHTAK